ncbi:RagB/SusD family nutrient uptake outer membrane protein [Mediterranea massiliensis]|uniref:RagB/SusD family nutrient uptake outer membrane protein n=1 Tax=Mediterranea massiliensis TaxID=1841865 RepID=UPI0009347246|nr:RagB/SusD family nutrient uptake outer membrane protein [Mediterranea massiliensis]
MKTYISKILIAVGCLLITSCNDVFDDLSINPNQIDLNSFYTTPENVEKGILGAYGYISTPRNLGACGFGLQLSRSDEASSGADYSMPGTYSDDYTSSYYTIVQPFQLMYTAAGQACQMIQTIPNVDFVDEDLKNAYLGEAYFLRAFTHFFLFVNYRNIPLIKEMTGNANEYRPQASPEECWDFIINDLKEAERLLPMKGYWDASNLGRATKASAAALLGKAYLYRSGIEKYYGNSTNSYYNEAAQAFGRIINGEYGSYKLVEDYNWNFDVAHENNDESIWEIQFLGDVINTNFNPGFVESGLFSDIRSKLPIMGQNTGYNASNAQVIHDWVYDVFVNSKNEAGETDPRMFGTLVFNDNLPEIKAPSGCKVTFLEGDTWADEFGGVDAGFGNKWEAAKNYKCASRKWLDWTLPMENTGDNKYFFYGRAQGVNWRWIRYSDVLLMYAETLVMGGEQTSITALEAINEVRDRVHMPHVATANMETVEHERILELTYEGHRFYDLLRWGRLPERFRELEASDPNFKAYNNGHTYKGFVEGKHEWVPIPIEEVEGNPYITSNNPGW